MKKNTGSETMSAPACFLNHNLGIIAMLLMIITVAVVFIPQRAPAKAVAVKPVTAQAASQVEPRLPYPRPLGTLCTADPECGEVNICHYSPETGRSTCTPPVVNIHK